jgi:predicted ATPase/class 3 adenylate cyclase
VSALPTGTVTFLFTDIEGSTRLWEQHPEAMRAALARHDALLRHAIGTYGGRVFKSMGDAFCAAFATAPEALVAALSGQRALQAEAWNETGPLQVRMALHTGAAEERDGDYFGPPLNRVARLLEAGRGGQILLSLATQELARDRLPEGASLRDLGEHRLKDLVRPERIFQLLAPDLPADFARLRTLDTHPQNLPLQPTPLIGREREVEAVRDLLRREEVRLLTFTGAGGTGKTRLALQVAADLLDDFADGVFFVVLAPISDPELVAVTIAQVLGVQASAGRPLRESLKEYLQTRQLLLLLDNFEQVLPAASLVAELLASGAGLKVLVTSRAGLHLRGEHEFQVPPLAVPDPKRLPPVAALSQYAAVQLFIQRAVAVEAAFAVTSENAPAVAEICHRLEGLPLAIELAAARIRLFPLPALLVRLERRLPLLTGGARDLPARQQTLRGAIAWSYDLLEEPEKTLFRRLSVFVGGFTLEAAEALGSAQGDLDTDVLDGVASLVDKSLLRKEAEVKGEPRFSMLETIREFGLEQLAASGEEAPVRRRHGQFFLEAARWRDEDVKAWLDRHQPEQDNLRAALVWAEAAGEDEFLVRLVLGTQWLWGHQARADERRQWHEKALARATAL